MDGKRVYQELANEKGNFRSNAKMALNWIS